MQENRAAAASAAQGRAVRGDWILATARAARRELVQRDWSDMFDRLGLGATLASMRPELRQRLAGEALFPQLPSLHEFATIAGRVHHTPGTRALHYDVMRLTLEAWDDADAAQPHAAAAVLPVCGPARKRRRVGPAEDTPWQDIVAEHLRAGEEEPLPEGWPIARQVAV